MNIPTLLSFIAFVTTFILGINVYSRNPKDLLSRIFTALCFFEAYWCFIEFEVRISTNYSEALFWSGLNIFWNIIIALIAHFALVFSKHSLLQKSKIRKYATLILLYCSAFLFSILAFVNKGVYGLPVKMPWGSWDLGPPGLLILFYINTLWASSLLVVSVLICFHNRQTSKDHKGKKKAGLMTAGLTIIIITGILTEGILPALNIKFYRLTSIGFIAASLIIRYTMKKYELFSWTSRAVAVKIIDKISDVVFLTNGDNTIETINIAASNLLGYSPDELTGIPFQKVIDDAMTKKVVKEIRTIMDNKKQNLEMEVSFKTKHNENIPVALSGSVIMERGQYFGNKIFIAQNISEKEKAQKAEEVNLAKSEFLLKMGHDFRNPLTPIIGISDMMVNYGFENLNNNQKDGLQFILQNATKLLDLIDAVLDLNRIEAGKMDVKKEPVSLEELKKTIDKLTVTLIASKRIEYRITIEEGIGKSVITDKKKLETILFNLIDNAIKYTIEGMIEISIYKGEEQLRFRVRDTGKGITGEEIKTVFDLYNRNGKKTGGLGLPFCKMLVRLLGGDISISAATDIGTAVEFYIPYKT